MTIILTDQLKKDLILVDSEYSQKNLSKELQISINKMMKMRDDAGLRKKNKGRPKGTGMTFKGEEKVNPEEIEKAKNRILIEIKVQKQLTVYPDIIRPEKLNTILNKLKDMPVEDQLEIIKDFNHEQSRIEEFINK